MPVTPSDTPSSPENYAQVAVQSMNIQAPLPDLSAEAAAAQAVFAVREQEARQVMESPAGYGEFNVTAGFHGGGGEEWPSSIAP